MVQRNYNPTIGYLKAFGIMLMVLGHACHDKIPGFPYLMPFIVMFHMPIFLLLRGIVLRKNILMNLSYMY